MVKRRPSGIDRAELARFAAFLTERADTPEHVLYARRAEYLGLSNAEVQAAWRKATVEKRAAEAKLLARLSIDARMRVHRVTPTSLAGRRLAQAKGARISQGQILNEERRQWNAAVEAKKARKECANG